MVRFFIVPDMLSNAPMSVSVLYSTSSLIDRVVGWLAGWLILRFGAFAGLGLNESVLMLCEEKESVQPGKSRTTIHDPHFLSII